MSISTKSMTDDGEIVPKPIPTAALDAMAEDAEQAGGEWQEKPEYIGSVGRTMFDSPTSKDDSIVVLLPREQVQDLPSQALVRIPSQPDGREYLGVVVEGPFAEPDGLRADAPLVVTTTVRGGIFMPRYHGRVNVALMGERIDGVLQPPRFRPLPNSPVFRLGAEETAHVLNVQGDLRLGLAVGHENLAVAVPSNSKAVLPRHTGIIGTTGGGKSTTVAGFVAQAQQAGIATVLLDVEGEYTFLGEPTDDPTMKALLERQGRVPAGVQNVSIYHLVGRESSNPRHLKRSEFSLRFSDLSPFQIAEILDLNEAQQDRFFLAYDATSAILRQVGMSDVNPLLIDEQESGYPGLRLSQLIDVMSAIERKLSKGEYQIHDAAFAARSGEFEERIKVTASATSHPLSWRAILGKLTRLQRLGIFDHPRATPIDPRALVRPGQVSIVDLSDTDSPHLNNLVIADILRGVQRQQEIAYDLAQKRGEEPPKTLVIVEEAHEFLSRERIAKMPVLFQQVARIAKRGRKRWLGLVFVTQLPQHLPNEVIALVNNWVIHKIADAGVIANLKRSVSGIDEAMWNRLPSLAPGQAVVSFGNMPRPLLVAIDPTAAKLRMVD